MLSFSFGRVHLARSTILLLAGLGGCFETVPFICGPQQDCPSTYTCNAQHHCVLSTAIDAGEDMTACAQPSDCEDGGADLGDGGAPDAAPDLRPMCTPANVMVTCTDPAKPVCGGSGTCAACTGTTDDAQCAAHMNGLPRCDSVSGACVACRSATQASDCTTATAPICDANLTCRGCNLHGECPTFGSWPGGGSAMGVCTSTGACATGTEVLLVDNRGLTTPACDTANTLRDGTIAHPYCDIGEALPTPRPYVVVHGTLHSYDAVTIPNAAALTLSLIGPGPSALPQATVTPTTLNTPAINITSDNIHALDVTIDGLVLSGAAGTTAHGIQCSGPVTTTQTKVLVLRSLIQNNVLFGINANQCDVTMDQTVVGPMNTGGGVFVNNCTYKLTNSVIHHNGAAGATKGLVTGGGGVAANRIVNLTIADNTNTGGGAGIFCGESTNPAIFNLVLTGNATADVTSCTLLSTSAFSGATGTNQSTTACSSADLFVSPTSGDYTPLAAPGGACTVILANMGTASGAPDHDLNGNPRPRPSGSKPDIGAVEIP